MLTIIFAVLLGLAIIVIGLQRVQLLNERKLSDHLLENVNTLTDEKLALKQKLARRKERHLRASGEIDKQRTQLREKNEELERAGRWIQLFFELLDELQFDDKQISLNRNEARRLFVAS